MSRLTADVISTNWRGTKAWAVRWRLADGTLHDSSMPNEILARQCAASPNLLEALRDILQVITNDDLVPESVSYMKAARRAIAKAEGRSEAEGGAR